MTELAKLLALFAGLTTLGSGMWWAGDRTGFRPALKYELDNQGYWLTRQRLLEKVRDHTISEREMGILCGLSQALRIQQEGCE